MECSAENEIIETALQFMESAEMTEHLRKEKSWFDGWRRLMRASSIITGSRASLEDKLAALRLIAQKYAEIESESGNAQNMSDDDAKEALAELDKLIEAAEFMLRETTEKTPAGTIFLLRSLYLTKDDLTTTDDWEDCVPFASFDAAKSRLLREAQTFRETCGEAVDYKSYTISKWVHTQDDAMRRVITWYLSSEGLIWFADINDHFDERLKQLADDGRDLDDLNHELSWLTVPYVPGDIVTIDCRPTHEISHAVIAEIHEGGQDCCGIQVIYMTKGGELEQTALKHDINRGHYTLFTCMYRLEKYTGELPSWEAPLKKVSEMLKSDPSLGVENAEGDFFSRTGFRTQEVSETWGEENL